MFPAAGDVLLLFLTLSTVTGLLLFIFQLEVHSECSRIINGDGASSLA